MNDVRCLFLWITFLSLEIFPAVLIAEDEDSRAMLAIPDANQQIGTQCLDRIRECFGYSGSQRSQCFYACANHSPCTGTTAGRLSLKRWALTPNNVPEADPTHGFSGPQMVDRECLANFDNQWSSELIKGRMSGDDFARLENKLEACRHSPANEILRP